MKKILTLLVIVIGLFTIKTYAQAPEMFNYQAVVRNAEGQPIANREVAFLINVLQGHESGVAVYSESHVVATNEFGLASLKIGNGTIIYGSLSEVTWQTAPYFLSVEFDPEAGGNYSLMGTMQLVSVPYALHAKTVELDQVNDADADAMNELQTLSLEGETLSLSKDGGTITLPTSAGDDAWGVTGEDLETPIGRYGKVGIGTLDPAAPLVVKDDIWPRMLFQDPVSGSEATDGLFVGATLLNGFLWNSEDADLILGTNNTRRMTIKNNGFIGMGTDAPAAPLVVKDDIWPRMLFQDPVSGSEATDGLLLGTTLLNGFLWNSEDADLVFGTNNTRMMTIKRNGYIGMGTQIPAAPLTIHSAFAPSVLFQDPDAGSEASDGFLVGTNGGDSYLWNYENKDMFLGTNNTEVITITGEGYVGIGADTVKTLLHVVGQGTDETSGAIAYFETTAEDGVGIFARAINEKNDGFGGMFEGSIGVSGVGYTSDDEDCYGVLGHAYSDEGLNIGVAGLASGYGANYGVYARAMMGTENYGMYCEGDGVYTGTWSQSSDMKLKSDFQSFDNALNKVMKLKPKYYNYRTQEFPAMNLPTERMVGFVTQDVEEVLPNLVGKATHINPRDRNSPKVEFKTVDYISMIPILTGAIQELKAEVDENQKQIDKLTAENLQMRNEFEKRLARLEGK